MTKVKVSVAEGLLSIGALRQDAKALFSTTVVGVEMKTDFGIVLAWGLPLSR